jgi:hypothetical protein
VGSPSPRMTLRPTRRTGCKLVIVQFPALALPARERAHEPRHESTAVWRALVRNVAAWTKCREAFEALRTSVASWAQCMDAMQSSHGYVSFKAWRGGLALPPPG